MRLHILPTVLLAITTTALQIPDFQPILDVIPFTFADYFPHESSPASHSALKRQDSGCPKNFNSCAAIGGSGLCCAPHAVCSADAAGHVACCPKGYACSGTIQGVITAGTLNSNGAIVGASTAVPQSASGSNAATTSFEYPSSSSSGGLVMASTSGLATGSGFVLDGTSTVATPGAAVRGVEVPMIARAIIKVLEYIPI